MPLTATTSEELVVGAGEMFIDKLRDGKYVPLGASEDANVYRVTREYFVPNLNDSVGPIDTTDYIARELAELESTIPEVNAANLALLVPGSVTVVNPATLTGGGLDTTLSAATVPGQYLALKVASVTGMAVGQFFRFGPANARETRTIVRVGTPLVGGTGIDLDFPLVLSHAATEQVVQAVNDGSTVISSGPQRRLPTSAYADYALFVQGLDGRGTRFRLYNAIMTGSPTWSMADADNAKPRLMLQGRRKGATATSKAAWDIQRLASFA